MSLNNLRNHYAPRELVSVVDADRLAVLFRVEDMEDNSAVTRRRLQVVGGVYFAAVFARIARGRHLKDSRRYADLSAVYGSVEEDVAKY